MPSRRLTFHQEIRNAVAARERLLLCPSGRKALSRITSGRSGNSREEADKVVTPILRLGDYSLVPDQLKLLHCEDFRDDFQFDFHLNNLARQLSGPSLLSPPAQAKIFVSYSISDKHVAERNM